MRRTRRTETADTPIPGLLAIVFIAEIVAILLDKLVLTALGHKLRIILLFHF